MVLIVVVILSIAGLVFAHDPLLQYIKNRKQLKVLEKKLQLIGKVDELVGTLLLDKDLGRTIYQSLKSEFDVPVPKTLPEKPSSKALPIPKIHYVMECEGMVPTDAICGVEGGLISTDPEKITCRRCLRKLD